MTIWSDGQYGHEIPQPDLPEQSGPTRSRRRKRAAAAGVAVCLVATGVGIAIGQATDHGPLTASFEAAAAPGTTTTTVPNSAPLPQPAWNAPGLGGGLGPFGKGMFGPFFGGSGTVTAVTQDSFKVKLRDGSTVTFTTSSSTSYDTIGVKIGRGELSVGETVIVRPRLTKVSLPAPPKSSTPRAAGGVTLALPTISGKVVSVSGSSVVIEDGQGFWHDVSLSSATVYGKSGKTAAVADIKTGAYVLVSGHIASDHQTLDAVAVQLGPFAGPRIGIGFGPGGRAFGGFGFRFPGYPGSAKNAPMQVFPGPPGAPTGNS